MNKTNELARALNLAIKQTSEYQNYAYSLEGLKKHPELFQLEEELKSLQQAILKERTKEDGDSYDLEMEYKHKLTLFQEHPLIVNYLEDKEQLVAYLEYMQTYIQGLLD